MDPETNEDKKLQPYQRELFPKVEKRICKQVPDFTSRGQVHGYSQTPFDTLSNPNWLQKPSGDLRIEYFEE